MRRLPLAPQTYDAGDQEAMRQIISEWTDKVKQPTQRYVVPDAEVIPKSTTMTTADTLAQTQQVLAQLLRDLKIKGVIS